MVRTLDCAGRRLALDRPLVMGILNVTPDSFSDGGRHLALSAALCRAREMVAEGADLLDIGGESTRPGAQPVSAEEELSRVLPVFEALAAELDLPLSVDTRKPEVMRATVAAGAGMINDVAALRGAGAVEAAARAAVPVCLVHMQGEPGTMQVAPHYDDVVSEVGAFLGERVDACLAAGIQRQRLLVDPGLGFGKTLTHNMQLLGGLRALQRLNLPILVGLSRKSMLGTLLDAPVDQRVTGGVAGAVIAVMHGAAIVRTHDVRPTVEALRIVQAVRTARREAE